MAGYAVVNESSQQNTASGHKTQIAIFNSATVRRIMLYEWIMGVNGSPPADNELEMEVARMTVDGTGTVFTPTALDPADAAALSSTKISYTAEPTVTANSQLYYTPFNQRAVVRWLAAPGSELIAPATAANGLVIRAKAAAYTSTVGASALFLER
jgi:hypothetical protein